MVWEHILSDFYSFNLVKVHFITQNVVCLGDVPCKLENEKNVYFAVAEWNKSVDVNDI